MSVFFLYNIRKVKEFLKMSPFVPSIGSPYAFSWWCPSITPQSLLPLPHPVLIPLPCVQKSNSCVFSKAVVLKKRGLRKAMPLGASTEFFLRQGLPSPGCPRTGYVVWAGLRLTEISCPCPASCQA